MTIYNTNHTAVKPEQLNLFENTLPAKPYAVDTLGQALRIISVEFAKKKRYIQPNSPWELYWLVYDVDRPTAHFDWDDYHAPPPNITVMNPANGNAHLFYGIEKPVLTCEENPEVHKKPIRYAAAVDIALTEQLDADRNYGKLIAKNPLHPHWRVLVWEHRSYTLDWLADWLDLKKYTDGRRKLPPIGLGRNCTMFDITRRWAYRERRKDRYTRAAEFLGACVAYAGNINAGFPTPLPMVEVRATGRSIGKWTWKNLSPAGFHEWCEARRLKSIQVRQAKSKELADEIRAFKAGRPTYSMRDIAAVFGCAYYTVWRALSGCG